MGPRTVLMSLLALPVLILAGTAVADSTAVPENVITGLEVFPQPDVTRVVLRGQRTPTFTVFKLKNPDRLVVDLIRCKLRGLDTPRTVDNPHIGRIATTHFKQAGSVVSRFIIGLRPGVVFDVNAEGSTLLITIQNKNRKHLPAAKQASRPPTQAQAEPGELAESLSTQAEAPPADAAQQPEVPKRADHRVVSSHGDKQAAGKTRLRRIVNHEDDSVTVMTSRRIKAYEVLEVFEPFRIVIDLYGADMSKKRKDRKLSGRYADRLRVVRHPDKVRLVLDCADGKRQPYAVKTTSRGIRILFDKLQTETRQAQAEKPVLGHPVETKPAVDSKAAKPQRVAAAKPQAPTSKPVSKPASKPVVKAAPAPQPPAPAPKVISTLRDLSFRQEAKEAHVILDLEGDAQPEVVHSDQRSTVLEIPACKMPLILERTLDTTEFGSDVRSLSAYRVRGKNRVKLVAVTSNRTPSRLERRNGRLHWVFETSSRKLDAPRTAQPSEPPGSSEYIYAPDQVAGYSVRQPDLAAGSGSGGKKKRKFRGKRISLDFKDADIHNILRLISEVAKLNIITSDDVKGTITITMRNVPWDQALDIILKTKRLGKVRHGNIIRVATMSELAKENSMAAKAAAAKHILAPLRVRLLAVNYASASDIEKQVKDILSERGTITVDARTNVLIIKDVLENLVKAEGLVRSLDTETPQVLIEARIVEANTQHLREVGVQWGGSLNFGPATGNPTGMPFPNSMNIRGGADDTTTNTLNSGTANPGHFAINLPAAVGAGSGGALGFIFGSAGGSAQLALRLSALENHGAVKIISAPKITTLDNQTAKISQGVSIPISVVSAAGVNTQFVEAKLELEVTPHITQEGSVLMAITVHKNEPDFSRTGARGDPTILKKEAETQVMVRDGDTTVIGGIYTKKTSDTFTGIPLLSRIPVLGFFFRNKKTADDRTELLIFITPRIVNRLAATVSQK